MEKGFKEWMDELGCIHLRIFLKELLFTGVKAVIVNKIMTSPMEKALSVFKSW